MGLKFRRGSTAQQSGSLAFGEPYVNTTLGTLVVGGATGDIILSSTGTGSTGNFGAISGSGLDITGNANIAGNLTLGGTITIGDASTDNVVVNADLSSSIIPNNDNAFDLGSAAARYRAIYGTNIYGAINATNGIVSGSSQLSGTTISNLSGSFTGSFKGNLAGVADYGQTVAVSSVGATTDTTLYPTFTTTAIIGSYSSLYSHPSASFYYNGVTRQVNAEGFVGGIFATNGVISGSSQVTPLLPTGTVSGSSQVTYANISSIPSGIISGSSQLSGTSITDLTIINLTTVNQTASVVFSSGSNRFGDAGNDTHSFTGSVQVSGSLTTIGASTATSFNGAINATNGIVSGSSQINIASTTGDIQLGSRTAGNYVESLFAGANIGLTNNNGEGAIPTISLSTTLTGLTSVTSTGFTGALTGNASTATTAAALTTARTINGTSFDGSANITIPNLVSGSSQITLSSTTGYGTVINQNLLTTSDVRHNSLGIGMAASATAGRIDASNDVVAFSTSDIRFKENIVPIENALDKISKISGNTYDWKVELKDIHGYEGNDVGVIAQEVEAVLPQLVQNRDNGYKAVKYDKLVALLIEGIKEQQTQIHSLTIEIEKLKEAKGL